MAAIGDYKMSQVEQSEADAGRARDDNSWWVQRPEVDRLVAAAVEERDREIERLKQGLWDCAGAAGTDLDGDLTPRHLAYPDIVDFALNAVRELRRDYDEGLGEAALVAPAVTTGLEMNTNPEGTRNLD